MKSQHCNDTQYQFSFFFDCRKKMTYSMCAAAEPKNRIEAVH